MTQSEFGGAQRFIYTFVTALLRRNTQNQFIVAAGCEGDDENGLLFALEKNGINTRHLKYLRRSINPLFDILGVFEIKKLIKKEKPDVLFVNSTKAGILGGFAGRLARSKKIIYRIGGWTFNDPWPNWKKKMYILIEKYTAGFKDYIVNNAESDRQQAIKLGIKPRKEIIIIHNGMEIDKLEFFSREEARKEIFRRSTQIEFASQNTQINADNQRKSAYPERDNQRVSAIVGTIANFYPPKGLEYLIEAAGLMIDKKVKFIIIGDGQDRLKLEDLIKKHNLNNNFILTGAIPDARKYLKAFDVFVLPSVKEGFPWAVLEAMVAEIPVIATRVGAVPEIIENNKNGIIIDSRNPEQIKNAINTLLNDKNLSIGIAKEGRKTAVEKFNLQKMVKKYEDLFLIN